MSPDQRTHEKISAHLCGRAVELDAGHAKVVLDAHEHEHVAPKHLLPPPAHPSPPAPLAHARRWFVKALVDNLNSEATAPDAQAHTAPLWQRYPKGQS